MLSTRKKLLKVTRVVKYKTFSVLYCTKIEKLIIRKLMDAEKINILSKQFLSFFSTADKGQDRRLFHSLAWSPLFDRRSKAPGYNCRCMSVINN